MKRLVITGFGCPPEAWQSLFPTQDNTRVLSFADVLEHCDSSDLRVLAKSIEPVIISFNPDIVILHDYGVVLGLLALINIHKRNANFAPKVIVFNGALGGLNIFKATHPFKLQFASYDQVRKLVRLSGGKFDNRLKPHFSRIKKIYRQVILVSLVNMIKNVFQSSLTTKIDLGNKMLIIASDNDPYIPMECLHKIANNFCHTTMVVTQYGHYPYQGNLIELKHKMTEFEAQ